MTDIQESDSPIQEGVVEKGVQGAGSIETQNTVKTEVEEAEAFDTSVLTSGEKLLGVLSYFSFFFILTLLMKPKSEFCQLHGKQGMILTLGFLLLKWVIWFGAYLSAFFYITYFLLAFVGVFFAAQGKMWKYPIIGDFADKIKFD